MRRYIAYACVIVLPVALFFNVWQSFRYEMLDQDVSQLEEEQREIVEENKRLIAGIAVLRSPARIQAVAEEELELEREFPAPTVYINIEAGRQDDEARAR
ncbi:MAG: cell division protein FtsL [Spirochaetota bacterium]